MIRFKALLLTCVAGLAFTPAALTTHAQITVSVGEPNCPYGYYDTAPYSCAPSGYYGPEWFNGGVFIGAGQWFHGPADFRGNVNNHFHPEHGYKGALPARGEGAKPENHVNDMANFKGNEVRDGHGNAGGHASGGHGGGGRR